MANMYFIEKSGDLASRSSARFFSSGNRNSRARLGDRSIFFILAFLFLAFFLFSPREIFAATLSINPSSGTYEQGERVTVKVKVSSDVAPNAVSAILLFPPDVFAIDSVSKADSILNFWVTEPRFNKYTGIVNFEGVTLNGFQGTVGSVITVTFHALKTGTGKVAFQSGQILANDGEGTDITKELNGATYSFITPKPKAVPAPVAPVPEVKIEVPQPFATLKSPEIIEGAKYGEPAIVGTSQYPNSQVLVTFVSEVGIKIFITSDTDENGNFTLLIPRSLKHGTYKVRAQVVESAEKHSYDSNEIVIIAGNIFSDIPWFILLLLILLLIIIFYVLMVAHFHLRNDRLKRYARRKEIKDAQRILHESFNVLREDVVSKQGSKPSSGKNIKVDIKADIDEAEKIIKREIDDI